jgi:two-component system, NtrC family, sensor kinase
VIELGRLKGEAFVRAMSELSKESAAPSAFATMPPIGKSQRLPVANRLGIGAKIGLGYTLALGIAMAGTGCGIILGNYYQRQAVQLNEHAEAELQLLYQLQSGILQARTHQQQFIPLLASPQELQREYAHFLEHEDQIKKVWAELQTFAETEEHHDETHFELIPELLAAHAADLETYFQQVESLLNQISDSELDQQGRFAAFEQLEALLFQFTNSPTALRFDAVSDHLIDVIQSSDKEREIARAALIEGALLRNQIAIGSMLLSITVAVLLAVYTSRAIARPVIAVTDVARRVTQDSNFDLQIPVTSTDEVGMLAVSLNQLINRVKTLMAEQKAEASRQLIQSEKMSSLGRMVAGVAHEINNPINFVYGNLNYIQNYTDDLLDLLHTYQVEVSNPPTSIIDKTAEIDLEFLEEDLPKILQSMKIGADRARQIVLSLKNFSRLDEVAIHPVDVHACLDSTLLILNNRVKHGITILREYGEIPAIEGYSGSLYQVFMNLLSNAIEALDEQIDRSEPAKITIATQRLQADQILIEITDNGVGITPEDQAKVFDTFFTTKPTGVGTGLGLSISRQIVEEKHHGHLSFKSEPGKGTVFSIILPISQASGAPDKALSAALAESAIYLVTVQ